MTFDLNKEFKKIYFRRGKIILNDDDINNESINTDIYDIFKKDLLKRISEIESFKDRCILISCKGVSVTIRIDESILIYGNGHLKRKVSGKLLNSTNINNLSIVVSEEIRKLKKSLAYALTLNENINTLGYTMEEKMLNGVAALPVIEVEELYNKLISYIKEMKGADFSYHPVYSNFPSKIMSLKKVARYFNNKDDYNISYGIAYPYFNYVRYIPDNKYLTISIKDKNYFNDRMIHLMYSSKGMTDEDISDLTLFFLNSENFIDVVPDVIPNKINLAVIASLFLNHGKEPLKEDILSQFTTVTDVLRLAAAMSGQNPSLPKNVRFKSFSNQERRFIMNLLNKCQNRREKFHRHHNMWKRVWERIHPRKFKSVYPDLVEDITGPYLIIKEKRDYWKQIHSYNIICEVSRNRYNLTSYHYNRRNGINNVSKAINVILKSNPSKEIKKKIKYIKFIDIQRKKGNISYIHPINTKVFEEKKQEIQLKIQEVEKDLIEYKKTH